MSTSCLRNVHICQLFCSFLLFKQPKHNTVTVEQLTISWYIETGSAVYHRNFKSIETKKNVGFFTMSFTFHYRKHCVNCLVENFFMMKNTLEFLHSLILISSMHKFGQLMLQYYCIPDFRPNTIVSCLTYLRTLHHHDCKGSNLCKLICHFLIRTLNAYCKHLCFFLTHFWVSLALIIYFTKFI